MENFNSNSNHQKEKRILLTKEMFIQHLTNPIEQDYDFQNDTIGQGAYGTVFKATKKVKNINKSTKSNDKTTDSSFSSGKKCVSEIDSISNSKRGRAIKRIDLTSKYLSKELLENQIQILSYLDHPLIVKLYEIYKNKNSLYLVQDLLQGDSLFAAADQENKLNLSQDQLKIIFEQLIRGISYLHAQNICHRDIKLENILFVNEKELKIKLIDFGLAYCWEDDIRKQLKKSGQNKKLVGTTDYMSPDIIAHNYDQRTDLWSAGVTLYILLSGRVPFEGDSDKEIMNNIKNFNYTMNIQQFQNVSEEAKDLISKLLKPEDERLSIQEILSHPWLKNKYQATTNQENLFIESTVLTQQDELLSSEDDSLLRFRKGSDGSSDSLSLLNSIRGNRSAVLTIEKMLHFSNLSKLHKLLTLFSALNSSQNYGTKYSDEFMKIDKDADGSISLQDLISYLQQKNQYDFSSQDFDIEYLFQQMDLNQRNNISYSEYLACIIAWNKHTSEAYDFLSSENTQNNILNSSCYESRSEKSLKTQSDTFSEIDNNYNESRSVSSDENMLSDDSDSTFDNSELEQLFAVLDRDQDGYLSEKDFINFFKNNGVYKENAAIMKDIIRLIGMVKEKNNFKKKDCNTSEQHVFEETGLPNSYKGEKDGGNMASGLSKSYKGDKDGGLKSLASGLQNAYKGDMDGGLMPSRKSSISLIQFIDMFKREDKSIYRQIE